MLVSSGARPFVWYSHQQRRWIGRKAHGSIERIPGFGSWTARLGRSLSAPARPVPLQRHDWHGEWNDTVLLAAVPAPAVNLVARGSLMGGGRGKVRTCDFCRVKRQTHCSARFRVR